MNALVVGSSGLVGTELLKLIENDSYFATVTAMVRKKITQNFQKVAQSVVDFDNLSSTSFSNIDIVFCCLGTTIKTAGSKEAFRKVDFEYPLAIAKMAKENGVKCYAIVTAMGADADSSIFYNKVKGQVENSLSEFNFDRLGIFRPSMLLGERTETRIGERIGQVVMNLFGFLIPKNYKAIDAQKVASAMVKFAKQNDKTGKNVIFSGEMH